MAEDEQAPKTMLYPRDPSLDPHPPADFYHHDQRWSNRMLLGDSLLVMSSLAEKEGLKGKEGGMRWRLQLGRTALLHLGQ